MKNKEKTKTLLINHYNEYPKLKIQDVFKYLYQSSFGCEHMITSPEMVTEYLYNEIEDLKNIAPNKIEELDGNYSRIYLGCVIENLRTETLGKLFALSAKKEPSGKELLEEKLLIARELIIDKLLPFSLNEFDTLTHEWKSNNYPSIHHSEEFRNNYHPAYRVISNEYIKFIPLFKEIDKKLKTGKVTIAIEGCSGSGKTTLGGILEKVYDCTIFHMDDFFLRPEQRTEKRLSETGGNIDRERFLAEVLEPLQKNETIKYKRFNCSTFKIEPPIEIKPKKLTIIEGVYSMHPEFSKFYDLSVFLNISPKLQKERILKRNSIQLAERFFNEWIPLENNYFTEMKIKEKCDFSLNID